MATKKISELPLVNRVSGSQVAGGSVLPIVIGGGLQGTTNQISVENFSVFVNAYNAHTGSAGNVFTGPQTINNNVTITGKLTVNELVATYETASIIYSEGGNIFGNELIDKQQFTGSSNFTGSVFINGQDYTLYSSSNSTVFTNFSSSNSTYNTTFSSSNSSYNTTFSSSNAAYVTALSSSNSSYNTIFSSSNATYVTALSSSNSSYNTTFSSSNSSYNTIFSSSNSTTITAFVAGTNSELARVYQTTQSLHVATASLNAFTASQDSRNFTISQYTSSTDAHIVGISAFTSSQLAVNLGNSIYTASVDSHIVGISTYTSSVRDTLARVHQTTQSLHVATASLQQFTASQDSRNLTLSTVTGSLIGITNGLMAFTAALDNTYATDAQLYQLYQSTRSLELHSGSMIGVTNGLMAYTASNTSLNTGLRGEVDGIEAYTASLKGQAIVSSSTQIQNYDVFALNSNLYNGTGSIKAEVAGIESYTASLKAAAIVSSSTQVQNYDVFALNSNLYTSTGSLIGITNGLMAFTAALDSTYATDVQLFQLYQATRSIELTTGSLIGITNGLMAFTAALDSTYATDAQLYQLYAETASIKAEIGGIEAYTASLKGAAIVSSSQQITNYYKFAETASANTFYGTQTISGDIKAISNTGSTLKSVQLGTAVNGTGGGNRGFDGSFTGTTTSFTGVDAVDQGYGYFPATIVSGNTYTLFFKSVETNGTLGNIITSNGTNFATNTVQTLTLPSVTNGVYNTVTFTASASATHIGFAGYPTTGTITLTISEVSLVDGIADANIGKLIVQRSLVTNGDSIFKGNQSISGSLAVNSVGASGISIISNGDSPTLNFTQLAQANGGARNWRLIPNYEGWGTLDVQVSADNATLPSTTTRVSMTAAGDVNIKAGNLVMGTSGKGIDFSATSNGSGTTGSELLNDYEEGTFTPTYTGTNLTVVTYGNQFGWYTKVGRLVTVTICLMTEDITVVGSENLKIGGLPFTSNSTAQATNALVIGDSSRWSTNPPKYGVIQPNVTEILLYRDSGATGAGTDPVAVKTDDMADVTGNRNVIRATLTYFV